MYVKAKIHKSKDTVTGFWDEGRDILELAWTGSREPIVNFF